MPISAFFTRCIETAARETRVITVFSPDDSLPQGQFALSEFYCDEPGCDCRRVIIRVHRAEAAEINRPLATLSFGWEPPEYYQAWMGEGTPLDDVRGMWGLELEALSPQSRHSDAFLEFVRDHVLTEPGFVDRLKRHYAQFKAAAPAKPARRRRPGRPGGGGRRRL